MIITLSGAAGSGKSTIAQRLATELKWPRYYIGAIRREEARKRGLSLEEYNKLGETDPQTDIDVDEYQKKLGQEEDNFIIEGRTSWHFIPHSLKIYLDVSLDEAAKRVFLSLQKNDDRNEGKDLKTLETVKDSIQRRAESDALRYRKYYDLDVNDKDHYDLYLDTTSLNPNEVYSLVFDFVKNRLDSSKK